MAIELTTTTTGQLTTLERVRYELDYLSSETADDTRLGIYIAAASTEFRAAVRQPIISESTVYELPSWAVGDSHTLALFPVTAISALEYYAGEGTWTVIDTDRYALVEMTPTQYRLEYYDGFTRGTRYRATITVGYASVPTDIDRVVAERAVLHFLDSPGTGKAGKRLGVESIATTASGDAGMTGGTTRFSRTQHNRDWANVVAAHRRHP